MSLITDCLAAGGTLMVTFGSGLQAYGELRQYSKVARSLHLDAAADATVNLVVINTSIVFGIGYGLFFWWLIPLHLFIRRTKFATKIRERISRQMTSPADDAEIWVEIWRRMTPYGNLMFGWALLVLKLPHNLKAFFPALKNYLEKIHAISTSQLDKSEQDEAKTLAMKAGYWTLIMFGTFVIFTATSVAIAQDLLVPAAAVVTTHAGS